MDALRGPRCDMCGKRVDAVFMAGSLKVCAKDKRTLRAADRSGGASTATGRPPHLAAPMGSRYRGPVPAPQRRKR